MSRPGYTTMCMCICVQRDESVVVAKGIMQSSPHSSRSAVGEVDGWLTGAKDLKR